jgi:hypothetical protein
MPTKQQEEQHAEHENRDREQVKALIRNQVLRTLGQPGGLHRVQVRPLWEDHYRVNVLVGPDAASAKVAHSYFLVTEADGSILACTPKLTRQY